MSLGKWSPGKVIVGLFAGTVVISGSACDRGAGGGSAQGHAGQDLQFMGPQFPGAGSGGAGSSIAAGLDALSCKAPGPVGAASPTPVSNSHETCLYDASNPNHVAGTIEWIVESAENRDLVHVRLTLNPDFVDNTYGANAIGWGSAAAAPMPMGKMPGGMAGGPKPMSPHGHTFKDLVGSDHAEFKLSDGQGRLVMQFDLDYITASAAAPSGYACLGVSGGEGKMLLGSAADVVAYSTSLDRDLNACGYHDYLVDSPATDSNYTPNPATPDWDYRVVYDVWVKRSAFGTADFGSALVDFVHASPSKASSASVTVTPGACPPAWPYCADPHGCMCQPGPDTYCAPITCGDGQCDAGTTRDSGNPDLL